MFKTALEVALIAAEAGVVTLEEGVVAFAGMGCLGGGAGCSVFVRPSAVPRTTDLERGLEAPEMIAMPRIKFNEQL